MFLTNTNKTTEHTLWSQWHIRICTAWHFLGCCKEMYLLTLSKKGTDRPKEGFHPCTHWWSNEFLMATHKSMENFKAIIHLEVPPPGYLTQGNQHHWKISCFHLLYSKTMGSWGMREWWLESRVPPLLLGDLNSLITCTLLFILVPCRDWMIKFYRLTQQLCFMMVVVMSSQEEIVAL